MSQGATFSDNAMMNHLEDAALKEPTTAHGFHSSARTWLADEQPGLSWEAAELFLAHQVGTAVSQAYMRSDYLDQRRPVMQDWADFVTSGVAVP